MKLRIIAVTGSRKWTDEGAIILTIEMEKRDAIDRKRILVVMHGDCPTGADAITEKVCAARGIHTFRCAARWLSFGKKAGPIRNEVMAALKPAKCYAFPLPDSRGTYDCINAMNMEDVDCIEVGRIILDAFEENAK